MVDTIYALFAHGAADKIQPLEEGINPYNQWSTKNVCNNNLTDVHSLILVIVYIHLCR